MGRPRIALGERSLRQRRSCDLDSPELLYQWEARSDVTGSMPGVDSQPSAHAADDERRGPRPRARRIRIWAASALLLGACATAPHGGDLTSVSLDRDVHFLDPQGAAVLARKGTYVVTSTAAASQLRLYPSNGSEPLTLTTRITTHEEVEAPLPLALFLSEGDEVHVALLLPEKKALDALGFYTDVRVGSADTSPPRLSERYQQAALERRTQLGGWQNAGDLPDQRSMPNWHALEISTDLDIETFGSRIGDRTWPAYRVSPGAVISVSGLGLLHVQSIDAVRLAVYTGPHRDPPIDDQGEFDRPMLVPLRLDPASVSSDRRSFVATVDPATSGVPPGAAYLEVDYRRAGESRTIALGSMARPGAPSATWLRYRMPPLYFVPQYAVYLGEIQISLTDGGLENDTEFIANPLNSGFVYPQQWVVVHVDLRQSSGFSGASNLKAPCASATRPRQGYQVRMEPPGTGKLELRYQLVGPKGLGPPDLDSFDSFNAIRDYDGARLGGFPLVPRKPEFRDRAYSLGLSAPNGCSKPERPPQ